MRPFSHLATTLAQSPTVEMVTSSNMTHCCTCQGTTTGSRKSQLPEELHVNSMIDPNQTNSRFTFDWTAL